MRASGYSRAAADFYVEPRWCVDALLEKEPIMGVCWDPACGSGTIPRTLRDRGVECLASDIVDRGYGETIDFFGSRRRAVNIVSNPPFGLIEQFIRHGMELAEDKVIVLARLALLESVKRLPLFADLPFARVYVSASRISMPPGGSDIRPSGGSIAYGWFVFEHGHSGPASIHWIAKPERSGE